MSSQRRRVTVLTERQHEVLALMLEALSHHQIARQLSLSTQAVQKHMISIWDRLCMPDNREYALAILSAFYKSHGPQTGDVIPFGRLAVGQQFKHEGQTFSRVARGQDHLGPFNALNQEGDRALFYEKMLVEVASQ